jgi:tRNA threonylcarbamoyladenosine biosynthesis protein TsaB
MSRPIILSVDTATRAGSVWLGKGNSELASTEGDANVSQSNRLLRDVDELLTKAGLKLTDVDLFACAAGPGSFTGLRIGLATIKALAASLERPCAGISTLEAIAHAGGASSATVATLAAGRGEFFAQLFSVSPDNVVTAQDPPAHLSPEKLIERYSSRDLNWAGITSPQHREFVMSQAAGREWHILPPTNNLARHIAVLALQRFEKSEVDTPYSLRAIYVRPSDAELNQKCN